MTEHKKEGKRNRGFAAMSDEKRREIARKGGKASPTNFKVNRALAARAGATRHNKTRTDPAVLESAENVGEAAAA